MYCMDMMTPKTLTQAVDQSIARKNNALIRAMCPFCMGTGTYYKHLAERNTCPNCKGSGLWKDVPSRYRKVFGR